MKSRRQPRMGRSVFSLALIGGALMLVGASGSLEAHAGQYEQADIEYGARSIPATASSATASAATRCRRSTWAAADSAHAETDRDLDDVIRNGRARHGDGRRARTRTPSSLRSSRTCATWAGSISSSIEARRRGARPRRCSSARATATAVTACTAEGRASAPDLSSIGAIRTAATLERSLLDPTGALLPINRPVRAVAARRHRRHGPAPERGHVHGAARRYRASGLCRSIKLRLREYTIGTTATMPSYADALHRRRARGSRRVSVVVEGVELMRRLDVALSCVRGARVQSRATRR